MQIDGCEHIWGDDHHLLESNVHAPMQIENAASTIEHIINAAQENNIITAQDSHVNEATSMTDLSYSTNEASLIKLFSRFGHIVDVHIARHEETKESKGYAFIQYGNQEDAILAIEEMDCKLINGRAVYTDIAKPLNAGFIAYPKTCGPPLQQSP